MAKLIVLCGLPGSGKSSYAERLITINNTFTSDEEIVIHSSDAIRQELFGDAGSQEDNGRVFELMHKRTREDLKAGKTVIYDATNITRKARKSAIACAHPTNDIVECHIIWAEPSECIYRDSQRERRVGHAVIDKMIRRWQSPWKDEGFDSVEVMLQQPNFNQVKYISQLADKMHIPHENPHHTLGVWEHCMQAHVNVITQSLHDEQFKYRDYNSVATAAYWHDLGKPYTKFFKPGEEVAHYYDHHCVGGYLSYGLFLRPHFMSDEEIDDACFISWIISNHMEPFFNSSYYQKLNPQWKWYIDAIHEADVNAH